MSSPLVSVIIPCFNSERHIRQAVESCLTQDYKNLEVIVVDDGSTDNSLSTLRAVKDKKLKIIRQANQGGSAARNQALRHVRGKYIQYLDADDFISKDKISAQVKILEETTDSYLAVCKTIHFFEGQNPDNGILHETWPLVDTEDTLEWLVQLLGTKEASMVAIHIHGLCPKRYPTFAIPGMRRSRQTLMENTSPESFSLQGEYEEAVKEYVITESIKINRASVPLQIQKVFIQQCLRLIKFPTHYYHKIKKSGQNRRLQGGIMT